MLCALNGSRLCAGGDLEHKSFKLALKPIRITTVDVSTSAPLAQNRCYAQCFLGVQIIKLLNKYKNGIRCKNLWQYQTCRKRRRC